MTEINARELIEELQFDIKTGDKLKAHLVLKHLADVDPSTRKVALLHLARAETAFTISVLTGLLADCKQDESVWSMFRETLFAKALENPEVVLDLMRREVRPNHRMILAELLGEIGHEEAVPTLMSVLHEEQDEQVLRSLIDALGQIGDPVATTSISEYLYSSNAELIIAAIGALGQIATPTAIQRLSEKLGADPDLDIIILDVLASTQLPEAMEQLNNCLSSQHAHVRNAAKRHLVEIGAKSVPFLIENLRHQDPDLLIHTLNLLGEIGDESAIAPIRKLLHNEPADANVRFAAYEALGRLPVQKGAITLAQGLEDPVENVRTAAAKAIDFNYNTILAAGVKNMIRAEDPKTRPIGKTIIDAQCDNIFLDLMETSEFRRFALDYIGRGVHSDIREHYIDLLRSNDMTALADQISRQAAEDDQAPNLKVFAVDDSKMILNIYRSSLHQIGCEPVLFANPQEAVAKVREIEPDFIFTDLNMPEMTGVDLIRAVRRWFDKDKLPIVMVTTQNECSDNEAAMQAGANQIINKPFTAETLKKALDTFLASSKAA